jgi:hypothetical protein
MNKSGSFQDQPPAPLFALGRPALSRGELMRHLTKTMLLPFVQNPPATTCRTLLCLSAFDKSGLTLWDAGPSVAKTIFSPPVATR